jgi:hypothetical protein
MRFTTTMHGTAAVQGWLDELLASRFEKRPYDADKAYARAKWYADQDIRYCEQRDAADRAAT